MRVATAMPATAHNNAETTRRRAGVARQEKVFMGSDSASADARQSRTALFQPGIAPSWPCFIRCSGQREARTGGSIAERLVDRDQPAGEALHREHAFDVGQLIGDAVD